MDSYVAEIAVVGEQRLVRADPRKGVCKPGVAE